MKNIKNDLNGFLVIDKPYKMGSTQVISVLKYFLHPIKIGHAGTLDPLATGVLPIALGKATRLIPYVMDRKKTYQFTIKWGIETDSDDLDGREIATSKKYPTEIEIQKILPKFIGTIKQIPNSFSAIKINGKHAYDLSRTGLSVTIPPRLITIYDLHLLNAQNEQATFEVTCSKGTYVRTLAHDLSHALQTVGVVTMLRRTQYLPFNLTHSVPLENIKSGEITSDNLSLIPMESVLNDIPKLTFSRSEITRLSMGQRLSWTKLEVPQNASTNGTYCAQEDNKICGLVKKDDMVIRPQFIWI